MDFPHLKDTQFPLIDNVNVYKYQNNFDYARWNGKVSFKLLNVLWNSNYADVPYFNTDKERDDWFDSQDGYVGTLESLFNNTPENTVKIPIPYNDAYKYNYLVVEMPMQTSADNPINYEDASIRVSRWYYFIEDMTQFAPSTTELIISLDYWTTFIHSIEIPYLMLERGHAPMMQTTVEQFLANPIMNNEYLLADDFNYGGETIIKTSNYVPIGNGKKYVLWVMPFSKNNYDEIGGIPYSGSSTPPVFSDTSERWGYQIEVDGYQWKYGDTDYSNAALPIYNAVQTGVFNGCECYAIEGIYAVDFFNYMVKYHVNYIHAIQAMFILDESLFIKHNEFTYNGYTIYIADRKINNLNLQFTKEQFGFDSKYANITKLYTFPYSILEITDDEGSTFTARIENCGNVSMRTEVSLIYPFLNYNVLFTGINGDGNIPYTWKTVYDEVVNKEIWASDFSKYMMNWKVPTYTLYVSAENEYAANNFAGMQARRLGAIKDYKNSVRFGNTTRENTADSFATSTGNVNRTTSKNVTNTAATQHGLILNKDETNATNDIITDDLLNGVYQLGEETSGYLGKTTDANNRKIGADTAADIEFLIDGFYANADYFVSTSIVNGAASAIAGGIAIAGGAGGGVGGAGGIASGASGLVGTIATAVSIPLTLTNNSALTDIQHTLLDAKRLNASANMYSVYDATVEYNHSVKEANNGLRESITERFSGTNGINNANEARNKVCDDSNATATQTTETNNATWTRNANVEAEKANLIQKQREAEAQYANSRLQKPSEYGGYSGDFAGDAYQRRGVRFNVRTQNKSSIAQAGDAMLRFGYALHRVWDMSNGFHYCKNFTFWKAEDVWINDGSGVANAATNAIGGILLKGVTVWRDPTKIGTVGIYDNI